jgi:ABC-type transport system involved in multi-copper enzyme maturation permease subunit
MNALWMRQIAAVWRMEWRKTLFSKRGWWIYCLALAPVFLTTMHWLIELNGAHHNRHSLGDDSVAFAAIFQFFYLRGAIFFGCMGLFSNLFRGEMLEHTLHYYYLTPLRREMLVAGKYLAGLAAAALLFVSGTVISFLLIGRHAGAAYTSYIFQGPGLNQLAWYAATAALACVGYGAIFLMTGLFFRNPMIAGAAVFVWEGINPFMPSVLQKVSVIFYLRNLAPVEVPVPPPFNLMVIAADPSPAWLAIGGLLAVSVLLLGYTAVSARTAEIGYGE